MMMMQQPNCALVARPPYCLCTAHPVPSRDASVRYDLAATDAAAASAGPLHASSHATAASRSATTRLSRRAEAVILR